MKDITHTFHAIVGEALAKLIHHNEGDAERVIGTTYFLKKQTRKKVVSYKTCPSVICTVDIMTHSTQNPRVKCTNL